MSWRRSLLKIESLAKEAGASVHPVSIEEAHEAEMIFLAVPFTSYKKVAEEFEDWKGKIIVDVTNALHVPPESLGGRLSSEIVGDAFAGARLVKAFTHLPAAQLGTDPSLPGQRQAIFVSGNDADGNAAVAALIAKLGLAPVELGRLDQGGIPLHAVNGWPGGLLFQNLTRLG